MRYLLSGLLLIVATAVLGNEIPTVELQTNHGKIVLELDPEKAPKSVENFLGYVKDGFYEGTVFHRVIPNFMIQGGGFTKDLARKPTRDPVPNEANNGLKNVRGSVAMARTSDPNSATSQFFINVVDNAVLNYQAPTMVGAGYAVFGKVIEGMEVVDKIQRLETGAQEPFSKDVPIQPVIIEKATVKYVAPAIPEPPVEKEPPVEPEPLVEEEAAPVSEEKPKEEPKEPLATVIPKPIEESTSQPAMESKTEPKISSPAATSPIIVAPPTTSPIIDKTQAAPAPDAPTQADIPEPPPR